MSLKIESETFDKDQHIPKFSFQYLEQCLRKPCTHVMDGQTEISLLHTIITVIHSDDFVEASRYIKMQAAMENIHKYSTAIIIQIYSKIYKTSSVRHSKSLKPFGNELCTPETPRTPLQYGTEQGFKGVPNWIKSITAGVERQWQFLQFSERNEN